MQTVSGVEDVVWAGIFDCLVQLRARGFEYPIHVSMVGQNGWTYSFRVNADKPDDDEDIRRSGPETPALFAALHVAFAAYLLHNRAARSTTATICRRRTQQEREDRNNTKSVGSVVFR